VRQLGRLDPALHGHNGRPLDGPGVVERAEREPQCRAGALVRGRRRPVAEAGLVLAQPVADVVALERLRGLVGAQQPHAFGGVAVTALAAIVRIGHVVFPLLVPALYPSCSRRPHLLA
jgi:hypothetical protein